MHNINTMLTRRKFKIKLLIVQLIAVIPFLLFIFYLFDLWYDTQRLLILQQNYSTAQLSASIIRESFKTGINLGSILASDTDFLTALESDKGKAKEKLKNIQDKISELEEILIFDKNGKIITTTLDVSPQQKEEVNISDRTYFQEVVKTKESVIGNPVMSRFTGKKIVPITSPILKEGKVENIVVISYKIEYLQDKIEKTIFENGKKKIMLLDADEEIVFITGNDFLSDQNKLLLKNNPLIKQIKKEELVFIDGQKIPVLEENEIGVGTTVNSSGWIVLSVESAKDIFLPLFKTQRFFWLIISSAMIFAVAVLSFFLRKVKIVF